MNKHPISFIGKSGRFYIQNSKDQNRFAVYDSPADYNFRLQIPSYINREFAFKDFYKRLTISTRVITQQVQSTLPALSKKGATIKYGGYTKNPGSGITTTWSTPSRYI